MLQRIQSVFLLISAICMVICLCMKLATYESLLMGEENQNMFNIFISGKADGLDFTVAGLAALLIVSIVLSIFNIFSYSNLERQRHQCLLVLILIFLWYVGFGILLESMCPTESTANIEFVGVALPLIAAIFQILAARYIRHDINILEAADRIR